MMSEHSPCCVRLCDAPLNMNTKKTKGKVPANSIAQNRRARFDYNLDSRFEAGLVLEGWEVRSLRAGKVQLPGSFVVERGGELFLVGARINPLPSASTHVQPQPDRMRKLLLHRHEITQVVNGIRKKGKTCVCTAMYWQTGKAKVAIALARGKQRHDKRAASKERDWAREQRRIIKQKR